MRYYLDCEFNGWGGDLIALSLVADDGRYLYLHLRTVPTAYLLHDMILDPWVKENVIPHLDNCPGKATHAERRMWGRHIQDFLADDPKPQIVADWPDDIRYFCQEMIIGPGHMIQCADQIVFHLIHVEAYPTDLEGCVQHNAHWDSLALRRFVHMGEEK